MNILKEMLLIEDPSVFRLYQEMMDIAEYFIAPVFTIALLLEYFGEMNFGAVVKKLFVITIFMGAFYQFHSKAVELSLESASYTLKKVSPRNLFVKKWYHTKVRTKDKKEWNFIQSIVIPNLNDLLATAFFLLSKVFIWLLKLIYSSVYHLTYVFSGVTAILYFLGWTKDALRGTVQACFWCIALPYVIVAILALVGNSIDETALGGELIASKVDTIIWLFGVTLLLLISPLITFGLVKGDGIHSFGSKMGSMVVSSGLKAMALSPFFAATMKGAGKGFGKTLLEPSIKELLQKESSPDKNKLKLLDKKGSVKSPFAKGRSLDERLKSVGMTKDEAVKLSRIQTSDTNTKISRGAPKAESRASQSVQTGNIEGKKVSPTFGKLKPLESRDNSSHSFVKLQKQDFKFNQKYWDGISLHKAEAIKKKYGIEGTSVDPNKVHRPVKQKSNGHVRKEKKNELR